MHFYMHSLSVRTTRTATERGIAMAVQKNREFPSGAVTTALGYREPPKPGLVEFTPGMTRYIPPRDVHAIIRDRPAPRRRGRPDDLKRIRGIGILIEKKLNALEVDTYDQIARWTEDDIAYYDKRLEFKGRIKREDWVGQAEILAAGGSTEFSQCVDRNTGGF